jgi:hypothetical protein
MNLMVSILAAALAFSPVNLTGTWAGTIAQKNDDGTYGANASAWLQLQHDGGKISGTVGPSRDNSHPIENAFLVGDKLTFSTHLVDPESKVEMTWVFDLRVKDGSLEGMVKARRGEHSWEMRTSMSRSK